MRDNQFVYVFGPQKVEMLVVRNLLGDCMSGQFLEHDLDIHQAVASTINKNDGCLDVTGRILGDLVVLCARRDRERSLHFIVEHLEGFVSDDLQPMNNRLGATKREQMRVGCKLLVRGDVLSMPTEEVKQSLVDDPGEDARVEQCLPHGSAAQDSLTAEKQEQDFW